MKWSIIVLIALTTACSELNKKVEKRTIENSPEATLDPILDEADIIPSDSSRVDTTPSTPIEMPPIGIVDSEMPPPPPPPSDEIIEIENIAEDKVPEVVPDEVSASFPGGSPKLAAYYRNNFNYPQRAKDIGLEGKVYVKFTVNADGTLSNIHVLKKFDKLLDDAAIDFIKRMPNWIPATEDRKKVTDLITLPVDFRL